MTLPIKFAATGLLFLLPLTLLLLDFQNEINRGIRVAELERAGVAYSRPLTTLLFDVSQGGRNIGADLSAVDQADREHGDALGVRADWQRLRLEGKNLESGDSIYDGPARDRFSQHLIALLTTVGNNSNLILDPDMDSYYTMDTVLTQTPQLITNVSQARAVSGGADVSDVRQARLAMLEGQIQTPLATAGDDLRMATGYNRALGPRVAAPFQGLQASTATYVGLLDRFGSASRFRPVLDKAADDVFESGRRYNAAGLDALDWVLARRLHTFLARRMRVDLVAAVSACLAVAFFGGLYRTTMGTIRQVLQTQREMRQGEERYRSLVESSPESVIVTVEGRLVYVNGAALSLLGAAEAAELLGRPVLDFVHPDFHARVEHGRGESESSPLSQQQYVRRDGRVIDVESVSTSIVWEGRPAGQALIRDITERKAAEEAVRESDARLRAVIANVPVVVFALDAQGVFTFSDGQGLDALGLAPGEVVGRSVFEFYRDQPALLEQMRVALGGSPHAWTLQVGDLIHETHTTPLRDAAGRLTGVAGAAYDLTEHKRLEQQLAHQAFHDALTGLPNRALFLDRLEHALARAGRRGSSVAVLFVDLDNFKVVNDSLGHAAGDALLSAVAGHLSACIRPGDTLARLGGDEFTVLLEDMAEAEAATDIAARIAEALRRPLTVQGRTLFVSASIGVARSGLAAGDDPPGAAGDLLREADIAMYQAKNGGKARCAVFDRQRNAEAMERLELSDDLRRALGAEEGGGELALHYQPIVSLETGALQEVEALVRWEHPRRGLLAPLSFIPIAEETGLIVPLGLWVLREACRQARAWHREHPRQPPLVVGVNLSVHQLEQPDLVAQVAAVLEETGLPPGCLKLEITESVMMGNVDGIIVRMQQLKALGVRLAVDDFGTGYSSMAYLGAFPLDTLKIDRAFVSRIDEPEGRAILQAIVTLAHSLHLQVTSEGIETQDQWHHLRALGCEQGQGYYFARPRTPEALAALLSETASPLPPLLHLA